MVKQTRLHLSADDKAAVAQAIEAAETKTSGEIFVVVSGRTADYRWIMLFYGALVAILVPLVLMAFGLNPLAIGSAFTHWQAGGWNIGLGATPADESATGMIFLLALQAVLFMLVSALDLRPGFAAKLTPAWIKRQQVHRAARDQFLGHGLNQTTGKTGVLIFVSLAEHQAEIIADTGIYTKVSRDVWRDVIGKLVTAARDQALARGLIVAIEDSATILAEHFPRQEGDVDELPNKVIII
jgi:putative membrane protein